MRPRRPFCDLAERQLVDDVGRQAVRPIVGRDRAIVVEIERVLRHGHFGARRVESIRAVVDELAPRIVRVGAQPGAEPLVDAGLQRVVARISGVGAQPDDAARRIDARAVVQGLPQNGCRGLPSTVWYSPCPCVPT